MIFPSFTFIIPSWLESFMKKEGDKVYASVEDRMRLVLELSRLNSIKSNGGPFGAAIFNMSNNRLLAPGVNLVLSSKVSLLHAEIVAISLAQLMIGHYDLGGEGMPQYELVTSTEPCAMCFGAIPWSGVRRVVCGARNEDARKIGFDEGPKLEKWSHELELRGIDVVKDVCRIEAANILENYLENGGLIYNGREDN